MANKIAFFSPLPPARSGIADYSATLLEELRKLADVQVFSSKPSRFNPADFDVVLYQVGNNAHHDFCYETALEHPGVVVIHEANLHHLIADITIKRGDWDAYMRAVEQEGDAQAIEHSKRVLALETGPDYEGVPMLRRLLSRSKAAIVHSGCVETELRGAGFAGPIARIPHGAWIPETGRFEYRDRLGLNETTPSLDLSASVRLLGFVPMDDFVGYIAASDIVLNLRYPTVGENSGTLMRALGLGKAVIVSEVGSFSELAGDICLKAPVDATEEDQLFEYLSMLVSRPDLRQVLGARAREWVETECTWPKVAQRYAEFLERVANNGAMPLVTESIIATEQPVEQIKIEPEYLASWSPTEASKGYLQTHFTRLGKTLAITPPGGPDDRILEMGVYLKITPALKEKLGYGEVRGCYYGPAGKSEHRVTTSSTGAEFSCEVDLFDAEKDRFPYEDEYFDTVLCCELLEHLTVDPMRMLAEINRILKPGGHLVLTTPNIVSLRAIAAILAGFHPGFFPAYISPPVDGAEPEARHNREYAPREISALLQDSGFEVTLLETGPFREEPKPEHAWVIHLLQRYMCVQDLRGDGIYGVGRKTGPVRSRYPAWLYQ